MILKVRFFGVSLVAVAFALGSLDARGAPIGSPGNFLVVADSGITEFDASSGQQLGAFVPRRPNDFVIPGGRLYVTDASDRIIVYDAASGVELGSLAGPSTLRNAGAIALASNGDFVLLNQASGSLSVDGFFSTGEFERSLESRLHRVPERRESRSSGRLWNSEVRHRRVRVRRFSPLLANDMALGPDGHLYVTAASDTVMVLDGATGAVLGTYDSPPNPAAIGFRPVPEPGPFLPVVLGMIVIAGRFRGRFFASEDAGATIVPNDSSLDQTGPNDAQQCRIAFGSRRPQVRILLGSPVSQSASLAMKRSANSRRHWPSRNQMRLRCPYSQSVAASCSA